MPPVEQVVRVDGQPAPLSAAHVKIVYDGTMATPQLDHPEGLAFDHAGRLYCGGERGQIFRLSLEDRMLEQVGDTGGFCLGMAFDAAGDLFICDSRHAAVFRFRPDTGKLERFAEEAAGRRLRIPNFPAFDAQGNLYVSDSYEFKEPGPGIYRFTPDGRGELWCPEPLNFANGLAVAPDGSALYVVESFARSVSRVPILAHGEAGAKEHVAVVGTVPDGLAFDAEGRLYVSCYEPSAVYRLTPDGTVETLFHDPEAILLCHPTNCAFRGTALYTVNLGKCHITELAIGVGGAPLPPVPA
ncbi:SMP-30/gluconolactonase/LRE family protein [Nitrospira moscoviensis]|uniref:SMP-30/Gluconolaconase/LRE domain protein n=1 Tax=Nitrospira moscoviensis TaxID=42253 RepID=A0A0K2GBT0_NITMO|nr:SMP-30/gluconolactonase/LRE family protein [Nitrospira moscoviensis]ALA58406.1 SMP-30/Gluconolaconase/LRE domain protein [Nitrospira moscoviensis]